jgi:hypothetical protein
MSRLIFFAQPTNTEWSLTKLESTLHLFGRNIKLPDIEKLLLVHTPSVTVERIDEYVRAQKKANNQLELEILELPKLVDFVNWKNNFGLRDKDWIVLPNPGMMAGSIFHEIITSFDFREGSIGLCHHNPDGVTTTLYGVTKTSNQIASPEIRMKKIDIEMKQLQTLRLILEKSANGKYTTVAFERNIPLHYQKVVEIEKNGTYTESRKYITEHIDSIFGIGFEKVTQSVLSINRNLSEIYHSVYFGLDNRNSQEEDFFVMTNSLKIIWISCKFGGNYDLIEKEISRLKLKPPLNFPKERIYSILATSRSHAEKYYSEEIGIKIPDVFVCHLGNLNDTISKIENQTVG